MRCHSHNVILNARNLSKERPDKLGTRWGLDVEQFFHGQRVALLVHHHRYIIQPIKVGKGLKVGLVFNEFLRAYTINVMIINNIKNDKGILEQIESIPR